MLDVASGNARTRQQAATPRVVDRPGTATQLGVSLDLAAADGDMLVVGQDDERGEEDPHRLQTSRAPATDEGRLGQLAIGDEGDGDGVAGELPGEGVRCSAAQERGGDVGVDDNEAHARPARREA